MKFKKLLVGVLCAVMVLSMIPVMAIGSAAVDYPGDWMTYRTPADYNEPEEGEELSYKPAPGFMYDADGFHTVPANYKDTTVFFTVQSKEKQSVKDGIFMDMRVDDFSYKGEDGTADEWISFSIWDTQMVAPGATDHGSGWLCLLRGVGGGESAICESYFTTADAEGQPGKFGWVGQGNLDPILKDGKEHYELSITYDEAAGYMIKINDVEVGGMADINTKLKALNPEGQFYIGVTFHSTVTGGQGNMSIVKYGTSKDTATAPAGNDTKEPDENVNAFADPLDPNGIAPNKPALLMDATGSSFSGELKGQNMNVTPQGDNSFHVEAVARVGFITWNMRNSLTYMVEDFPVYTVMLKNYWDETGAINVCVGDVLSAQDDCAVSWDFGNIVGYYGEDEEYILVCIDLSENEKFKGRINGFRNVFSVADETDPDRNNFDVMYAGMFRSEAEATAYANEYMGVDPNATTEETTTEAPAVTTTAPAETTTAAPAETTTAPAGNAETTTAAPAETEAAKKGCGSVIGFGATAAVLAAAAAAVALKKRK